MTIHYHGTPISPITALYEVAGRCFCVSFAAPQDVTRCHSIGQSVMLDNGAFSQWKQGKPTNWPAFYAWAEEWLAYPTTWAVIPDQIDAGAAAQDDLLLQWPFVRPTMPALSPDSYLSQHHGKPLKICWPLVSAAITMNRMLKGEISRHEQARQSGIPETTLRRAENGQAIALKNFLNLCDYLEVRPERFAQ